MILKNHKLQSIEKTAMRMHAIVFEAAAISTQSDPPGTLLRPPIPPFMFVLGPSRGSPEASAQHQTISISVAPIFSPPSHHQHLLGPYVAPTRAFPAALFSHRISQ